MSTEDDRVVTVSILKTALNGLENGLEKRLEKRITEEGLITRAHFNIMVERVESAVKLVAEVNVHRTVAISAG